MSYSRTKKAGCEEALISITMETAKQACVIINFMDYLFLVGIFAAALTTSAFLPQVIKAHESKHTKDLSLVMYVLFSLGLILWIAYGIMLFSVPVIIANVVTLGLSLYLIYLKVKYG